jgi:septal ring factor EnvC (AmiA/AmiB activator)
LRRSGALPRLRPRPAREQCGDAVQHARNREVREELRSTNEELRSTNEELRSTNEELRSTNEELETMNDELHERSDETLQANSFLGSVLSSIRQGVALSPPAEPRFKESRLRVGRCRDERCAGRVRIA